jgi:RNA polymerase sigma-70 factor (ECF subfamily)
MKGKGIQAAKLQIDWPELMRFKRSFTEPVPKRREDEFAKAGIAAFHGRARSGRTEWAAIMLFYEQLIRISPTFGTRTGYAAAVAEAKGPEAGLATLDAIDLDDIPAYQPYWALRAHLLQRLGKTPEALEAFDRAIGLTEDPAVRHFLLQRRG